MICLFGWFLVCLCLLVIFGFETGAFVWFTLCCYFIMYWMPAFVICVGRSLFVLGLL